MNTWQIGNFTVSRIVEMQVAGGTKFILSGATRAAEISWLKPHFADHEGNLIMSIGVQLEPTPGHTPIAAST